MLFQTLWLLVMGRGGTEWSVGCGPNGQSLICNCVVLGTRRLHEPTDRMRQAKLPNRCRQPPSCLSSSQGECTQVVLRDSPWRGSQWQTSFNGEVRESSWPAGPGGTSQRPYVQLSPECDTVASASLPLINKGRAGRDSIAKCWRGLWHRPAVPTLGQAILFSSLEWAAPD